MINSNQGCKNVLKTITVLNLKLIFLNWFLIPNIGLSKKKIIPKHKLRIQ